MIAPTGEFAHPPGRILRLPRTGAIVHNGNVGGASGPTAVPFVREGFGCADVVCRSNPTHLEE